MEDNNDKLYVVGNLLIYAKNMEHLKEILLENNHTIKGDKIIDNNGWTRTPKIIDISYGIIPLKLW